MKKFVLALTGPTGSGKTTVAEKLSKQLDKCVNIDADHIKHSIPSGFYKDESNPGGWSFNRWKLVGKSLGLLAKNFQVEGYDVIINGYIEVEAWDEIEKIISISHKVLLLPELVKNQKRDNGRSDEIKMGKESVKAHQDYFRSNDYYHGFTKLDSSNDTIEETVENIKKIIGYL